MRLVKNRFIPIPATNGFAFVFSTIRERAKTRIAALRTVRTAEIKGEPVSIEKK